MTKQYKPLINEEHMKIQANLNNLDPGHSVDELRKIETANMILAGEEIRQQNENL
ncbi:hypothetical protein ACFCYN_05620 [Gottfriedia sp. NPDC056225]|uniref:hypothetical protein n=1 Tax=Gottfriedia sp. NPDC056225 TaxID=3345751 RepID=UPI00155979FF|nr:hypothetical protein HPK19_21925 [Arthrobacter citreus]